MFDATILNDGSVRLCACRMKKSIFDELVVGNVMNSSLDGIFKNEYAIRLRLNFIYGQIPEVCKECSFYYPIKFDLLNSRKEPYYEGKKK